SNPVFAREWRERSVEIIHQKIVPAIGEYRVDFRGFRDAPQHLQRKPADPDESGFPVLLNLPQRGYRLFDNLPFVTELDIVREQKIHVIRSQPPERFIDAGADSLRRKVEFIRAISAAFGREHNLVPPAFERFAKTGLGKRDPIVWRNVEEIDPGIDGAMHGSHALARIGLPEYIAERRRAKSKPGNLQPGLSERSIVHRNSPFASISP